MKRRISSILGIAVAVIAMLSCTKEPVRIACVGDSITFGHGIADRERDTYPAILDSVMGSKYDVRNFGISGRTLMNRGDVPYMNEQIYQDALAFQPQIVTILLGTNDSKPQNWVFSEDFKSDLRLLVNSFRELPTRPDIWLCLPTPAMGHAWAINDSVIFNGVIPYIKEVAKEEGLNIIDLNTPFQNQRQYFPDTIHPNEAGQEKIAEVILEALTEKRNNNTTPTK